MSMTFEELKEQHRKMWNWLADETEKRQHVMHKIDYFAESDVYQTPLHQCFCCQYVQDNYPPQKLKDCRCCPVDWGVEAEHAESFQCLDSESVYGLWSNCKDDDWRSAAEFARQIANLPIREVSKQ